MFLFPFFIKFDNLNGLKAIPMDVNVFFINGLKAIPMDVFNLLHNVM